MTQPDNTTRTAIVTGSSRGIGSAIAEALGSRGYNVAVNYYSNLEAADQTAELVRQAGGQATVVHADVGNANDRQRLVDLTVEAFGPVNLLVNNAGIPPKHRADLLEATEEGYDEVMDTNLKGPYFLSQLVARHMVKNHADFNGDSIKAIINMGSISAYAATHERSQYCIAKAGLAMMTQLFADRLADEGINVYEIRPGIINTDMANNAKEKYDRLILEEGMLPIRRWGEPEDVAAAVLAIVDGYLPYSTGAVIDVDGGFRIRRL